MLANFIHEGNADYRRGRRRIPLGALHPAPTRTPASPNFPKGMPNDAPDNVTAALKNPFRCS